MPRGGFFRWVSCPNYLGEMLQWSGFALATWSLPGLSFALWTVANLLPRAVAHHRWYRREFADYPEGAAGGDSLRFVSSGLHTPWRVGQGSLAARVRRPAPCRAGGPEIRPFGASGGRMASAVLKAGRMKTNSPDARAGGSGWLGLRRAAS